MSKASLVYGIVGASLWSLGAGAVELPAGPNKDFVARTCGACHDLQPLLDAAAAGVSRDDWNGALEEMTSYGLKVTPEQREQILEYLATFLGPSAKK